MHTNNKHAFYLQGKSMVVPRKWDLLRSIGKDKLSPLAQLKLEWIIFYHTVGEKNATDTALHFGISRKTLHKWLNRFDERRLETLEEDSRSPHKTRQRDISPMQRTRIIKLRKAHLRWGKMKQKCYAKEYGKTVSSWKIKKVIEGSNLYTLIQKHIVEYNSVRPHQALDYLIPLEYIDTYLNIGVLPMSSIYHHSEPRQQRLEQILEMDQNRTILALREGAYITIKGMQAEMKGTTGGLIFQYDKESVPVETGTRLDHLLKSPTSTTSSPKI